MNKDRHNQMKNALRDQPDEAKLLVGHLGMRILTRFSLLGWGALALGACLLLALSTMPGLKNQLPGFGRPLRIIAVSALGVSALMASCALAVRLWIEKRVRAYERRILSGKLEYNDDEFKHVSVPFVSGQQSKNIAAVKAEIARARQEGLVVLRCSVRWRNWTTPSEVVLRFIDQKALPGDWTTMR